jgi:hypothetical protein
MQKDTSSRSPDPTFRPGGYQETIRHLWPLKVWADNGICCTTTHSEQEDCDQNKRQRREHRRRESTAAWDESERSKTSSRASTHRTSDTSGPQKGQRPTTGRSASRRRRTASSRNRWEPNTSAIERRPAKPGLFNHGCSCWLEANQDLPTHNARSTAPFNVRPLHGVGIRVSTK